MLYFVDVKAPVRRGFFSCKFAPPPLYCCLPAATSAGGPLMRLFFQLTVLTNLFFYPALNGGDIFYRGRSSVVSVLAAARARVEGAAGRYLSDADRAQIHQRLRKVESISRWIQAQRDAGGNGMILKAEWHESQEARQALTFRFGKKLDGEVKRSGSTFDFYCQAEWAPIDRALEKLEKKASNPNIAKP